MAKRAPSSHINNVEASRVVGLQDARHLLSQAVASFEVGLTILGGQASLGESGAVGRQEDEAAESQGSDGGTTNDEVGVGDSLGDGASTGHWLQGGCLLRLNRNRRVGTVNGRCTGPNFATRKGPRAQGEGKRHIPILFFPFTRDSK